MAGIRWLASGKIKFPSPISSFFGPAGFLNGYSIYEVRLVSQGAMPSSAVAVGMYPNGLNDVGSFQMQQEHIPNGGWANKVFKFDPPIEIRPRHGGGNVCDMFVTILGVNNTPDVFFSVWGSPTP